jgi:hypothetical protein
MSQLPLVLIVPLLWGLIAVGFITGGMGSILCRNWARILVLVAGCSLLAYSSLVMLVFIMVVAAPAITHNPLDDYLPGLGDVTRGGIVAVATVLLPAIFLFFYSRKGVRTTCLAQKGAQVGK